MSDLFNPFVLRGTTFRNRAWISPMCQYSAVDGVANDWHRVHLGQFAVGGAGLVMSEATGVSAQGRITPQCLGLWNDAQATALAQICSFVRTQGAAFGVQLAHAGRKASTAAPWNGSDYIEPVDGGWSSLGPAPIAFGKLPAPTPLDRDGIAAVIAQFAAAARRADSIGADVIEIHGAHGYLIHTFLSPLSNDRTDEYGGDLWGRMRLALDVSAAVREVWPADKPLLFRVSATDWVDGGWTLEQTVELVRELAKLGVDLIDCSSGGLSPDASVPIGPGYQVEFAAAIRRQSNIPTAAVGLITEPNQAQDIIAAGQADAIMLGRAALRDPHWPHRAADELGVPLEWPRQYARARPMP